MFGFVKIFVGNFFLGVGFLGILFYINVLIVM